LGRLLFVAADLGSGNSEQVNVPQPTTANPQQSREIRSSSIDAARLLMSLFEIKGWKTDCL
jgi:hypothetical protein